MYRDLPHTVGTMARGKVYLVGAGPGDPELISLKGYRLISQADVIVYDRLLAPELLQLAKPGAETIFVGKRPGQHLISQHAINTLLVNKARANKLVVRLKGGDPYLFGRGGEEACACVRAGVQFEVVPGVTSALAAAAYAGIPLTHRDYTSSVAIVTGHRKAAQALQIPRAGTLVFLMAVSNVQKVLESLRAAGWPGQTRIAAVENGTCHNQRVITGRLANFAEKAQKEKLSAPAVLVVGRVAGLAGKLNWFNKKPRILVVGTGPEKYAHLGTIVHRPLIKLVPLEDYRTAEAVLKRLHIFAWLIFTSTNAVRFFFTRLNKLGRDARALSGVKVAAIGCTTADELAQFGLRAEMVPKTQSSAGLLREFRRIKIRGKKILIACSDIASQELPTGLAKMGAVVKTVALYRNIEIEPGQIDFRHIDRILFTSSSTVRAFSRRFGSVPPGVKVMCLGTPTLRESKRYGIEGKLLSACITPDQEP
jgi:uroporphyrinogen III methyltransferase/synthase